MYLWWEEAETHIEVGYPDIVTVQKKEINLGNHINH